MAVERHFLGWDRPVLDSVREFLLPEAPSGLVDVGADLIFVPTRQAGRRLREALARACADHDAALLSPRVVLPKVFMFGHRSEDAPIANGILVQHAWVSTLREADPEVVLCWMPSRTGVRDFAWALSSGQMMQSLRETLADGGYTIGAVVEQCGEALQEPERWQSMAELERLYLARLAETGHADPTSQKIRNADNPVLPDGVERVVVAAVPDPSMLTLRTLAHLQSRVQIDVLIPAPASLADCFDEWGRPIPDQWQNQIVDIPDPETSLFLSGTPRGQAEKVVDVIAGMAERIGPADIAVGVPDREVVPFLETALTDAGLPAFDPSDTSLSDHSVMGLLRSWASLMTDDTYAALSELERHPDVLSFLTTEHDGGVTSFALLRDLDCFQNDALPIRFQDLTRYLARTADSDSSRPSPLRVLADFIQEQQEAFRDQPIDIALRRFLQTTYTHRNLSSKKQVDKEFEAAADRVDRVLRDVADTHEYTAELTKPEQLSIVLQQMEEQTIRADRDDSLIDLEGWLELPWNDAACLIVTGMNEGRVPDGRLSDAFLPDSLRMALGLRDDATRLARDTFLMTQVIESRRKSGRAVFIVGKRSEAGDPLRPSRLLFRCSDHDLVGRAECLFAEISEQKPSHRSSVDFKLNPNQAAAAAGVRREITRLSVTAFRDYLSCPLRFYLGRVLRMNPLNDDKAELDALDFGLVLHEALQAMASEDIWRWSPDRLGPFLVDQAHLLVRARFGSELALPVQVALDSARQRLMHAANVQHQLVNEGWELMASEKKYEIEMNGMCIAGMIDRVDRHRATGALRIIDYKTSDRGSGPEAVHLGTPGHAPADYTLVDVNGKTRRWTDLQLPLYTELLRANGITGSNDVDVAYFNLPKAATQTGVSVWEGLNRELIASAVTCASEVIRRIRDGVFWPPSDAVKYDDYESLLSGEVAESIAAIPPVGVHRVDDGGMA